MLLWISDGKKQKNQIQKYEIPVFRLNDELDVRFSIILVERLKLSLHTKNRLGIAKLLRQADLKFRNFDLTS